MTLSKIDHELGLPHGSIITAEEAEHRLATGTWATRSLSSYLAEAVEKNPDGIAAQTIDWEGRLVDEVTYAQLDERSKRLAVALADRGVRPRDVVTVMMTNSADFLVAVYGVLRAGATYSGIPITYGSHEVQFMTRRADSKVLIVSAFHGMRDVIGDVVTAELMSRPGLRIVVSGGRREGLESLSDLHGDLHRYQEPPPDPLSIAQLAFTSGTTSEPKAVMNLHASLDVVVRGWADHVGTNAYGTPMRNLVMSAVGHSTGFMWGALLTVHLAGTAVFLERWTPQLGAETLAKHGITCMVGSPTFTIDLVRTAKLRAEQVPDLGLVVIAGAPIPRPLISETERALGCSVIPAWGMTEFGIAVSGRPGLGDINRDTDGVPVAAAQISIRGVNSECPADEEGDLWIRGAGLFAGYFGLADETRSAFDDDGWFSTGDTAVRRQDGSVMITGRTKDIIIRGGENVPVAMVENLIFRHPSVTEVAVVGYPDPRLGERACAFVSSSGAAHLTVDELGVFLQEQGLAKRYLPERVVMIDQLPKTMSGKIRKVELRDMLTREATPGDSAY